MKIILNEKNFLYLIGNVINENLDYKHPLKVKVDSAIYSLEKLLEREGVIMTNIENGKDYIVYEIVSLENLIGKKFCNCRLLKDGNPFGPIYTKPLALFKMKMY
jgi:hypothetical protein